ncbi:MAG: aldo/keto reductase, partial [Bacteroidia bacterium]|nr:aldo/keto reductase [Bacteroidia bacterium]
ISKCGIQLVNENRDTKIKHYNYSKEHIIHSVEESLKHLKTDYLDTLLLHRPSPLMESNEIAEAITHLQKSGKFIQFGVSNFTPSQVDLIAKNIEVSINQIEFSLTQHEAMHDGTLDFIQQNGMQAMSWSPLGTIFKEESPQVKRIKKVLSSLSEKYNASDDSILLSWIMKHPAKISPVIGTTNKERIKRANKALEIQLDTEDWFTLLAASQGHEVP